MFRVLSPLLVGLAVSIAAYNLPLLQRPAPPQALRARFAAQLSLWFTGVAALIALWPNLSSLFESVVSVLLTVIAVFAFSRAKVINRITVRGSARSWKAVVELFKAFSAGKLPESSVPIVVVEGRGALGELYAAHIPSFFSQMSDLRKKAPIYLFLPLDYLESAGRQFCDWTVSKADAYLLIQGPHNEEIVNFKGVSTQCWGKKHLVTVNLFGEADTPEAIGHILNDGGLTITIPHQFPYLNTLQEEKLATISRDLFNCTGVIHKEEQRLNELMPVIQRLRASAFQPIAKAYVRFRLSSSDTERLLGLFDCFEALIKTSAIVLIASRRAEGIDLINELFAKKQRKANLEHLATGDWFSILQRGIETTTGTDEFQEELRRFWDIPLATPFLNLIDAANGSGLAAEFEGPRSHAGWLAWMVTFRNRTRGHGTIREFSSRPIWPIFHECFLSSLKQLPNTAFGLTAFVDSPDGALVIPNGWPQSPCAGDFSCCTNNVYLKIGGRMVSAMPFLYAQDGGLEMLSSKHGTHFSYIDYSNGSFRQIPEAALLKSIKDISP